MTTRTIDLVPVVDASVGLQWIFEEADSPVAKKLLEVEPALLVPDFWLNEARNALWVRVRRKHLSAEDACRGLALVRAQLPPANTADLRLHDIALEIGMAVNHSVCDAL